MSETLPLSGITVFEFGSNVAGPFASWILAELGADVTKIERPEGDDARSWGPPFWNGSSTLFHSINRNKKSVSLDLADPDVAARLRKRIAEEADVVVQNLRPGALARLGFAPQTLLADNPGLIYCNLTAFGARGPLKDLPGYDALLQAFGGLISVTGEEGRPPVRVGASIIDSGTGMWCAIGILAALFRRSLTGKGGLVDASLFETALSWMGYRLADYQATGEVPEACGTAIRGVAPYQAYACADDSLMIAASNDRLFVKLAGVLGHPEWADDPRFRTNPDRSENRDELNALLEAVLATRARAEWQEKFDAAGVPNAPIQSIDQVLAHPQTAALGMAQATGDPSMNLLGLPLSFDGERPPLRNLAPPLGTDDCE